MQPALPVRTRPIGAVHDYGMAGAKSRARHCVFRLPINATVEMIESVRRDRVNQVVLRNMDCAAAVAARPRGLARSRRTDQDNQAASAGWKVFRHRLLTSPSTVAVGATARETPDRPA